MDKKENNNKMKLFLLHKKIIDLGFQLMNIKPDFKDQIFTNITEVNTKSIQSEVMLQHVIYRQKSSFKSVVKLPIRLGFNVLIRCINCQMESYSPLISKT